MVGHLGSGGRQSSIHHKGDPCDIEGYFTSIESEMKQIKLSLLGLVFLSSCSLSGDKSRQLKTSVNPLVGTWQLVAGIQITGDDTVMIDYTKGQEMIKMYNDTHFAFLRHDLSQGKDSTAIFVSGGGRYEVNKDKYFEHLDYCNYREWEGQKFELAFTISGDTLTTNSVEKIDALDLNHINIEKLVRLQ